MSEASSQANTPRRPDFSDFNTPTPAHSAHTNDATSPEGSSPIATGQPPLFERPDARTTDPAQASEFDHGDAPGHGESSLPEYGSPTSSQFHQQTTQQFDPQLMSQIGEPPTPRFAQHNTPTPSDQPTEQLDPRLMQPLGAPSMTPQAPVAWGQPGHSTSPQWNTAPNATQQYQFGNPQFAASQPGPILTPEQQEEVTLRKRRNKRYLISALAVLVLAALSTVGYFVWQGTLTKYALASASAHAVKSVSLEPGSGWSLETIDGTSETWTNKDDTCALSVVGEPTSSAYFDLHDSSPAVDGARAANDDEATTNFVNNQFSSETLSVSRLPNWTMTVNDNRDKIEMQLYRIDSEKHSAVVAFHVFSKSDTVFAAGYSCTGKPETLKQLDPSVLTEQLENGVKATITHQRSE